MILRWSFMILLVASAGAQASGPAPLAAQACLGCHGSNGAGMHEVPRLAGRDAAELQALMLAFRADARTGTIMGRIARGYSPAEIALVAEHFARQQP